MCNTKVYCATSGNVILLAEFVMKKAISLIVSGEIIHYTTYQTFFIFTEDDVQKIVSVCVDGKESQMVFIDHAHSDMAVRHFHTYFL